MGKVLRVLTQHWVALVSGPLSVALFFRELFMATPTSSTFGWVGAYLFGLVAAASVLWKWVPTHLNDAARLRLVRLASEGERLVVAHAATMEPLDSAGVGRSVHQHTLWREEAEKAVKELVPRLGDQFADLRRSTIGTEEKTRAYVQRLRDVLDVLGRS